MRHLNFSNIEELIFRDSEIQKRLPKDLFNYFEQWRAGQRIPMLRQLAKSAVLDLLNKLNDAHVAILEEYFGERVIVERVIFNTVRNLTVPLDEVEICEELNKVLGNYHYSMWRDATHLYVCFWR
jgi:single-stranded DNA-specific DHH superfamily exonuclease